jgi:hypothetical protein
VSLPDTNATEAAWGWLSRRAIPNPLSTLVEIVKTFWPDGVVADDLPNLSFPQLKIGYKVDCSIGVMHELPEAPLPSRVLSMPAAPESMASPALAALLSSTGELRAVVNVGGALPHQPAS